MNLLLANFALALVWAALSGVFSLENLLVGFILGYATLFLTRRSLGPTSYFSKINQAVRFLFFFIWELLIANLRVAFDIIWMRKGRIQPRVIAVPLRECGDIPVTILANVVSLTPGTLTLDVASDHCVLYVHSMYAPDREEAIRQIKDGFEQLVFDLMGRKEKPEEDKG
jgi:multicomponent Na+:H+ antiporter subunit E